MSAALSILSHASTTCYSEPRRLRLSAVSLLLSAGPRPFVSDGSAAVPACMLLKCRLQRSCFIAGCNHMLLYCRLQPSCFIAGCNQANRPHSSPSDTTALAPMPASSASPQCALACFAHMCAQSSSLMHRPVRGSVCLCVCLCVRSLSRAGAVVG